jgi:hypothetical protein
MSAVTYYAAIKIRVKRKKNFPSRFAVVSAADEPIETGVGRLFVST